MLELEPRNSTLGCLTLGDTIPDSLMSYIEKLVRSCNGALQGALCSLASLNVFEAGVTKLTDAGTVIGINTIIAISEIILRTEKGGRRAR